MKVVVHGLTVLLLCMCLGGLVLVLNLIAPLPEVWVGEAPLLRNVDELDQALIWSGTFERTKEPPAEAQCVTYSAADLDPANWTAEFRRIVMDQRIKLLARRAALEELWLRRCRHCRGWYDNRDDLPHPCSATPEVRYYFGGEMPAGGGSR